jgi:hypothetical protein
MVIAAGCCQAERWAKHFLAPPKCGVSGDGLSLKTPTLQPAEQRHVDHDGCRARDRKADRTALLPQHHIDRHHDRGDGGTDGGRQPRALERAEATAGHGLRGPATEAETEIDEHCRRFLGVDDGEAVGEQTPDQVDRLEPRDRQAHLCREGEEWHQANRATQQGVGFDDAPSRDQSAEFDVDQGCRGVTKRTKNLVLSGRETSMTSLQECNARAELCRQFARLEPSSKNLWLAEAERWSHLTHERTSRPKRHGEPAKTWLEKHPEAPKVFPVIAGW